MPSNDELIISLFSGAGGCSVGFAAAGLKPTIAADLDVDACTTYQKNLDVECSQLDLSTDDAVAAIVKRIDNRSPLLIVGGPPCQGFSTAGPRNSSDPRNRLIFNYLDLISKTKPRWFLFENVEGILTSNCGRDIVKLAAALKELGYTFRLEKVNFARYGLPQSRKRVLIIGNRIGQYFELPPATFSYDSGKAKFYLGAMQAPSLMDAIADLPDPEIVDCLLPYDVNRQPTPYAAKLRGDSYAVSHHVAPPRSDASRIAKYLAPGQTMKDLPPELQHDSYQRRANRRVRDGMPTEKRGGAPSGFKRLRGELNALTITSAAPREFIHPHADRALTLRECARLQSFSDAFQFSGSSASIARQIGNAIPPLAAAVLAKAIAREEGKAGGGGLKLQHRASGLIGFHLTDSEGMSPALANTARALHVLMEDSDQPSLFRLAHG